MQIKIKILAGLMTLCIISLGFSNDLFSINNLRLSGETDLNQCINHNLEFRWTYSHSAENYKASLEFIETGSVVWKSDSLIIQDSTFRVPDEISISDGNQYAFHIKAKHPDLEWSERAELNFTMNTPPQPVKFLNQDTVYCDSMIVFYFTPSSDAEIDTQEIYYRIQTTSADSYQQVFTDTTFSVAEIVKDSFGLGIENTFPENQKISAVIRSFDGVEYSPWSAPFSFYINRNEEPPSQFDLNLKNDNQILSEAPILQWSFAKDPEVKFGGGIKEYEILISQDKYFFRILEDAIIQADRQKYRVQKIENHCKCYWYVIARDQGGQVTKSNQIASFIVNESNQAPPEPILIQPRGKKIMKPSDYFIWRQPADKNGYDKLSFEISVTSLHDSKKTLAFLAPDSVINLARRNLLSGLTIDYNNIVRFRLNNFGKVSSLQDTNYYNFNVKVFDGWGGETASEWGDAVFQYDDNINQTPQPPSQGFSPTSEIISHIYPVLKWKKAKDPDVLDELRYQILVSRDENFHKRKYIIENTRYNHTEVQINTPLLENTRYFWKVRSIDLFDEESEWSEVNSFYVNVINEPPEGNIRLLKPESLTELLPDGNFWWVKTSDPDPADKIHYILELDEDQNFFSPVIQFKIEVAGSNSEWNENYPPPPDALSIDFSEIPEKDKLVDNQLYYWRIIAEDQKGLKSKEPGNPPRIAINLKNDNPIPVSGGFSPSQSKIVNSSKPRISWSPAKDPDFRDFEYTLQYQVQLSMDMTFLSDETISMKSGKGKNFIKVEKELNENQLYFYRLRTIDKQDAYSEWSQISSFITNARQDEPTIVHEGFIPKDSMVVTNLSPSINWLPSSDPDPDQTNRDLSYIVRYYELGEGKPKYIRAETAKQINSIRLVDLEENAYYSYQVAAKDPDGKVSDWSDLQTFAVNSEEEAPHSFSLLSPYFARDSVQIDECFCWENTYDSDPGDFTTFTLFYSTDSLFFNDVEEIPIHTTAGDTVKYCPPGFLHKAQKYFWKVAAEDNTSLLTWGSNSDERAFSFNTIGARRSLSKFTGPSDFFLYQNSPNPFNTITRIKYEVSEYSNVEIAIYDVLGKRVKVLVNTKSSAGLFETAWDGTDKSGRHLPGGMYLCRMTAKGFIEHRKVLLLR